MPVPLWRIIDAVLAPFGLELVQRFTSINGGPEGPGRFVIVRRD